MVEEKKSLVDEAYEKIRQKICDFELLPGQIISDFTLSKELNMSRTPIRQALQRVEHDGLIQNGGMGQSYNVCEITSEEITDLFDARSCIEVTAARLILKRGINEDELVLLYQINELMNDANAKQLMKQQFFYDQKFHDKLVLLSGNTRLMKFHESLLLQLARMRVLSYLERSYQDKAYEDHTHILEGLKSGNTSLTLDYLEKHIESTKENYIDLLTRKVSQESFGVLSYIMKANQT